MKSLCSAVIFVAAAGAVLSACQPSSEAPKTQQATVAKKEEPVYTVLNGNKVDAKTLEGWHT